MKAVLLVNIGSPESYDVLDVKRYLNRFLMDPYVIDIPFVARWILIRRLIVPKRAPNSAEAYKSVWMPEGSPLLVYTKRLIQNLNSMQTGYDWFMAMRYSKPYIFDELYELMKKNYKEIVIFPAYPQFADSSTTSVVKEVKRHLKTLRKRTGWQGKIKFVESFYDDKDFIENVVSEAKKHLQNQGSFDHYLFSYHGLPERHLRKIHKSCVKAQCREQINEDNKNCYMAQSYATTRLVAKALGIPEQQYSVSFQSRLGPSKWIEPYTDEIIKEFVEEKDIKSLAVFSLSFVTDCLETLEELDIRLKEDFMALGGEKFYRVPCLNENFYSSKDLVLKKTQ